MATEVLKLENGAAWSYSIKKGGAISKAGCRLTNEEAERRVAAGEAEWFAGHAPVVARAPSASEVRESYESNVQALADKGVQIQPRDWSAAMNRDD